MSYCESYEAFKKRIFSFQKQDFSFGAKHLDPSSSVKDKVNEDRTFRHFIGDTVVFDLDDSQKNFVQNHYVEPLYRLAGDCFAEKFKEHTLHMTLHDLNSSAQADIAVMQKMFETEVILAQRLREAEFNPECINMITTCVFNMVNTSLVLGLRPKTEDDYNKLMKLYYFVEDICCLPYPLTPHITLAYYNQNGFAGAKLQEIERVVNDLNNNNFEIILSTDRLYYQRFINMNTFFNIMRFAK